MITTVQALTGTLQSQLIKIHRQSPQLLCSQICTTKTMSPRTFLTACVDIVMYRSLDVMASLVLGRRRISASNADWILGVASPLARFTAIL